MRTVVAFALIIGALPARAQDPLAEEMAKALQSVRDSVGKSVVAIEVIRGEDPDGETGSGQAGVHQDYYNRPAGPVTGTIFSADGFILTTAFNVSGEVKRITVTTSDGRKFEAKRLGADRKLDIALLKIEAKDLPLLKRSKPGDAHVGDFVCVVGRGPDPSVATVNQGILTALGRWSGTGIQTDAEVNYGNVGGPLVTLGGELIGITSHIHPRDPWGQSSGVAFASKTAEIDKVLEDLKKGKDIAKPVQGPWIGVLLGEPRAGAEGVPVDQILPNSPAEEAGLDSGDVIAAVDGKSVKSVDELKAAIAKRRIGDEVELTLRRLKRDGKTWEVKKLKIKLGENPN